MSRTVTVRATAVFKHHGRLIKKGEPIDVTPKEAIALARIGRISLTRVQAEAAAGASSRVLNDRNMTARTPRGTPPQALPTAEDPQPPPGTADQSPVGDHNGDNIEDTKQQASGGRRPRGSSSGSGSGSRSRRTGAAAAAGTVGAGAADDSTARDQNYERTDLVGGDDSAGGEE